MFRQEVLFDLSTLRELMKDRSGRVSYTCSVSSVQCHGENLQKVQGVCSGRRDNVF